MRYSVGCEVQLLTDGTNDRTQEGCSSENAGSQTTLCGREHVGNDTTSVGERRRAKGTGKETQDDQSAHALGAGSTCVEGGEKHVGSEEQVLAAKEFWAQSALYHFCPKEEV